MLEGYYRTQYWSPELRPWEISIKHNYEFCSHYTVWFTFTVIKMLKFPKISINQSLSSCIYWVMPNFAEMVFYSTQRLPFDAVTLALWFLANKIHCYRLWQNNTESNNMKFHPRYDFGTTIFGEVSDVVSFCIALYLLASGYRHICVRLDICFHVCLLGQL